MTRKPGSAKKAAAKAKVRQSTSPQTTNTKTLEEDLSAARASIAELAGSLMSSRKLLHAFLEGPHSSIYHPEELEKLQTCSDRLEEAQSTL